MASVLIWSGFITMGLVNLGAMFPLWKSATLSPDSIQRWTYWIGNALAVALLGASQLPDWRSLSFFIPVISLWFMLIAFKWTNHIKINGRVYTMDPRQRRPDRPPALAPKHDDDR